MSKRNIQKLIILNDEEYAEIAKRAAELGMRTGTYIRYIAVHGEIKKFDMQIVQDVRMEMHKIGVNVNQIAHMINSSQSVNSADIEKMQIQIRALSDILEKWLKPLDVSWSDDVADS